MKPKEYLAKYFTNVASVITLVGCLAFAYKWYYDVEYEKQQRLELEARYARLIGSTESGRTLDNGLFQLRTEYLKKPDLAQEGRRTWQDLRISQEERLKNLQDTLISFGGNSYTQKKADRVFKTKKGTKGYALHELRLKGLNSPPLGYVMLKRDGSIHKKTYKMQIELESARIKDDFTGQVRIVTRAFLIPQEGGIAPRTKKKNWKGSRVPLEVSGGTLIIDPVEPLNPRISTQGWIIWPMNLNGGFGLFGEGNEVFTRATLDVNLFGYGYSKRDLEWKLVHLGANYSNEKGLGLHVMPFTYRPLPDILTNTYVGPGYFLDDYGDGYFLGLSIGF